MPDIPHDGDQLVSPNARLAKKSPARKKAPRKSAKKGTTGSRKRR
ncbi:MAG TPA: hypothetical protein VHD32_10935 [Candidatus Didemnitutus sp.]|nr:hypothetical protein [Candidatus Didemnitutus sp.]